METLRELIIYYSDIADNYISKTPNSIIKCIWDDVQKEYLIIENGFIRLKTPKNTQDELTLLRVRSKGCFEILKRGFENRHDINNIVAFKQELEKLESFLMKMTDYSLNNALNPDNISENPAVEYIRLNHKLYYRHNTVNPSSRELIVYTLCIYEYFFKWLKEQVERINRKKFLFSGYKTNLEIVQLKKLHKLLVLPENSLFSKDTSVEDFLAIFNPNEIVINRITWIAKQSRAKTTSKNALLDLLNILGIYDVNNPKRLDQCFCNINNQPLRYNTQNFNDAETPSEYHNKLIELVDMAKQ